MEQQLKREENYRRYQYYEIIPMGTLTYYFDNNHSTGNGHNVPALFFTDNQNIQWYRAPNGKLIRRKYLKYAVKAAIIFKHV